MSAQHGLRNARLVRELQALMEEQSQWAAAMRAFLLDLHTQTVSQPLAELAAERARQRYREILSQADLEEPPPQTKAGRGRPKNTPGRNLLRRLQHGAEVYARLQAIISTCRKQDRNAFALLRNLFAYQPLSLLAG